MYSIDVERIISYILAIQNALRQGNLNPEIEEKLLNLQRCHEKQMKGIFIMKIVLL